MQITSYILGAIITPSFAKSGSKIITKSRYKTALQNRYENPVVQQGKEVGQVSGVFRNNRNNRKENGGGYVQ